MHAIGYRLSVAAAVVVALDACASCPDTGFSAPGAYTATLDSQSTTSGPTCVGVDALVTGGTLDLHFESNGTLVTHCTTWIDRAGSLSAPSYPPPAGVLGEALGFGVFTTTLASGCTGRWEVNLADLDPEMPFGTTPDTSARSYYLTRVFIPDDVPACHAQFGAFPEPGAICADSWAVRLISHGP